MAWTQELQTVEDWEDDEGRERERLRPPQSDFLSLLACRQGTGHSVSASYRLHRSLQCEVNSCTKSRYRLLVIILNSFFISNHRKKNLLALIGKTLKYQT